MPEYDTCLTAGTYLHNYLCCLNKELMKVEIWSDVMCPFCYIGKRRFEEALRAFPHKEAVHVTWKSFQLNPNLPKNTGQSINEYLAGHKGISLEQARQMNDRAPQMASEAGLRSDFDKAVVAPSFDAHRFSTWPPPTA